MDLSNFFDDWSTVKIIASVLDLLIVWYVLYLLITVFKGTKAIQLLKGIVVIVIGQQVSKMLNLTATSRLFDLVIQWGVLALIVIFQPEIRRALEQLGRGSLFRFEIPLKIAEDLNIQPLTTYQKVIGLAPEQPQYRILIVEDKWENRQLLRCILEPLGFKIKEAQPSPLT